MYDFATMEFSEQEKPQNNKKYFLTPYINFQKIIFLLVVTATCSFLRNVAHFNEFIVWKSIKPSVDDPRRKFYLKN
jgi:hypothetical protein